MTFLLMLVMLVALSVCFTTLLSGVDPAGRAIASIAAGACMLTLIAQAMLSFGLWSPTGGLAATVVLCALLAGAGRLVRPRRAPAGARPPAPPPPARAEERPVPAAPAGARRAPSEPPPAAPRPEPARRPVPESDKVTRHDGIPIPPKPGGRKPRR